MCINRPWKHFAWSAHCLSNIRRIVIVPVKDSSSLGWKNEAEAVEVDNEVSFIDSLRTLPWTHYHRPRLLAFMMIQQMLQTQTYVIDLVETPGLIHADHLTEESAKTTEELLKHNNENYHIFFTMEDHMGVGRQLGSNGCFN